MRLPPDITYRIVRLDEALASPWEAMLSVAERQCLEQWKHEKRRREFIAGRVAARLLLAERLHTDPAGVPIAVQASGAVSVAGHPLYLSISHSGDRAVAVAGERPLGVDLEQITPRLPDLHRFILHPDEYDPFESLPLARNEALILYWSLKEAVLKAECTGFRRSPKSLKSAIDLASGSAHVHVADKVPWQVQFMKTEDCYLAVAYRGG